MTAIPVITTPRLTLRALEIGDAAALHDILSDPDVMRYWSSGPHSSVAETRDYVASNAQMDAPCWAIVHDTVAIGWVILIPRRTGVAEIGYILGRKWWGQGLVSEAVRAVLDHGFSAMGLRRICADTDPDNETSMGLLAKLGFRREGYLREEWETHIGVRDSVIFALLRSDWVQSA